MVASDPPTILVEWKAASPKKRMDGVGDAKKFEINLPNIFECAAMTKRTALQDV